MHRLLPPPTLCTANSISLTGAFFHLTDWCFSVYSLCTDFLLSQLGDKEGSVGQKVRGTAALTEALSVHGHKEGIACAQPAPLARVITVQLLVQLAHGSVMNRSSVHTLALFSILRRALHVRSMYGKIAPSIKNQFNSLLPGQYNQVNSTHIPQESSKYIPQHV